MKKTELDLCVTELRSAAKSLTLAAEKLAEVLNCEKSEPAQTPSAPEPKPVTLEWVRAILAEKSRNGHTDKVRELLLKHGADKLSAIDPAEYPALLAEAEAL